MVEASDEVKVKSAPSKVLIDESGDTLLLDRKAKIAAAVAKAKEKKLAAKLQVNSDATVDPIKNVADEKLTSTSSLVIDKKARVAAAVAKAKAKKLAASSDKPQPSE